MLKNKWFWARCATAAATGTALSMYGVTVYSPVLYVALVGNTVYGLLSYYEGKEHGLLQGARWIARRWVKF